MANENDLFVLGLDEAATKSRMEGQLEQIVDGLGKNQKITLDVDIRQGSQVVSNLNNSIQSANRSANNLRATFGQISAAKIKLDAFRTIEKQAKNAVTAVKELNDAMTLVSMTMPNMTDAGLNKLADQSLQMAQELSTYSKTVLDAVTIYANANETAAGILKKAQPTVLLASASGMSAANSADIIQGIMSQFKMTEDDAMHIADSIEKLSSEIAMDFSQGIQSISQAVKNGGSVISEAGMSFEKYGSIVSAVAEQTRLSGSVLGNAFKTIAARITRSKSGEATDEDRANAEIALNSVGVSIRDANGEFLDLSDTLDALSAKWGSLTNTQRSYIAEQAAGIRQKNIFIATMDTYSRALELEKKALNSDGTAMQVNEKRVNSIDGKMQKLSATMTELYTDTISDDAVKGLLDFAVAAANVADNLGLLRGAMAAVGAAGFANMIGKIVTNWGTLVGIFTNPVTLGAAAIGGVVSAFTAYNKSIEDAVQNAKEAGDTWTETNASLQQQVDKIIELRDELASGTLTEEEAYTAKSNLFEIQQQLSESYGDQVAGIDLVNGSLREQIGLIEDATRAEAERFLNENRTGINEAEKQLTKIRDIALGQMYGGDSPAARQAILDIADKYQSIIAEDLGNNEIYLHFMGNAEDAESTLNSFMSDLRAAEKDIGEDYLLDTFLDNASAGLADANAVLDDCTNLYKQAQEARLVADKETYQTADTQAQTAAKWLNDYAKAVEKYNTALTSGDTSAIKEAAAEFEAVDSVIQSLLNNSGMAEYAEQFAEVGDQLNRAAIANMDYLDAVNGKTTAANKDIKKFADQIKQLGLDDIDFMDAFETEGIQRGETAITALVNAAERAGVISDTSTEQVRALADMLVEAGVLTTHVAEESADAAEDAADAYGEFNDKITDAITHQNDVVDAMNASKSATGLTSEEIDKLTAAYKDLDSFNADELFERTAHGVHLNKDALQELQAELNANTEAELMAQIASKQRELNDARAAGVDTSGIETELTALNQLAAQFDAATSAYNRFITAMNGGNERDNLESVAKSYEGMQEILNQGWYGDESLNAYLDLMLSAAERTGDAEADFAKLSRTIEGTSHSLKDYFTFDDNGNFTEQGIDMFLNDVSQTLGEGYAKIDENGEWVFDATGDKLQEIADKFGTSTEMVELFARAMQDAGMHVDFEDDLNTFTQDIENAKAAAEDLQKEGKISSTLDLDFNTAEMSISEVKSKIDELKGERAEVDVEANPEGAAALDELIEKCEQEYFVRLNAETGGTLDQACALVEQLTAKVNGRYALSVDASVQNEEEINTLAGELAALPPETQVAVGVTAENVGNAAGIVEQLKSDAGSISVPVNYTPGEVMEAPEYKDQNPLVKYTLDAPDEPEYKNQDPTVTYHLSAPNEPTYNNIERTITYTYRTIGSNPATKALGTAHVAGTVNSSSGGYSKWATAVPSTKAYVNGTIKDWSLKQPEDALVNETGTEGIVRNGRFMLLPGGAHIEHLERGDIVFNAVQTEELLKNGRVLSNGGHGRVALAGGTAYNGMPAHGLQANGKTKNWSNSTSTTTTSSGGGGNTDYNYSGSNYTPPATNTGDKKKSKKDEEREKIDYVEMALDRIERKIGKLKTAADSAYKTFSKRNNKLASEITSVSAEIDLQNKAYKRYVQEANSVGLSKNLADKVKSGTIDITEYGEDTAKKIQEYQQWYEKALDCKDAVQELNEELSNLYRQQFDLIITEWATKLQDLQHEIEHTTSIINRRTDYASEYVKPKNSRKASKQNIADYQGMVGNAQAQIEMYEKERNELIDELNSGKVKEDTEAWYEMLAEIQEVDNSIDSLKENIIEYSNNISAEYKNIFDSVSAEYENKMGLIEHMSNEVNTSLSKAEEKGRLSTAGYYENLKKLNSQSVKKLSKERTAMEEAFYNALSSGEIEVGSQAYYDMQNAINGVTESLQDAEVEVVKLDNQIRKCKWDNFDYLQDRISQITSEADFLIDLLSSDELYQDNGQFSSEGMATAGLHAVNYNTLMSQADDYAEQIEELNKLIALDQYDTNLIERREELLNAQQQAILAAEDEKQAIKSLVEEGIKIEIDNLKELVDSYKEALDSSKDLYDYQKRVEEQTKNISKLEKELSAYKGDTSEETKAQIQRIKLELEQSKEDLEETEYEHMISAQKEMLDNLVNEYELTLNTRLDNLDALVSDMITQVNLSAVDINSTLTTAASSVGYTMSTEMTNIWTQASAAMEASNLARTTETQRLLDQMVADGTLDRAKADEIKAALGAGDLQGITNAQNIINKLEAEGLLTAQQALDLRNTVSAPYVGDGVVAMYGKDFSSKMTTTNDALASIKSYCQTMEQKAAEEAAAEQKRIEEEKKQKEEAEKQAQAAAAQNANNTKPAAAAAAKDTTPATTKKTVDEKKPAEKKTTTEKKKTTKTTEKKTTKKSTQGDGKIQVGDQVTYKSGEYYYSSDGLTPTGHQERGNKVYVGKINTASWAKYPYSLYRDKGFTRPLGWVAKSQISGYATGLKKAKKSEPAWVNEEGLEAILSPSKSAVITHVSKGDSVLDAEATKNLFAMANDPSDYLGNIMFKNPDAVGNTSTVNVDMGDFHVELPNVMNYEQFKRAMQKDKKLEQFFVSMLVDPMLGKSKSGKNRFNF